MVFFLWIQIPQDTCNPTSEILLTVKDQYKSGQTVKQPKWRNRIISKMHTGSFTYWQRSLLLPEYGKVASLFGRTLQSMHPSEERYWISGTVADRWRAVISRRHQEAPLESLFGRYQVLQNLWCCFLAWTRLIFLNGRDPVKSKKLKWKHNTNSLPSRKFSAHDAPTVHPPRITKYSHIMFTLKAFWLDAVSSTNTFLKILKSKSFDFPQGMPITETVSTPTVFLHHFKHNYLANDRSCYFLGEIKLGSDQSF